MVERRAIILSFCLSLLAMYLVWEYVSNEETRMQSEFGVTMNIVVAKRDILQYETIRPNDVATLTVPAKFLPPGLILNQEDVYDSVAAVPISNGEFILDNKIISKNIYSGLDTQVGRGKRAMSVPVNVRSSVGYMLRPGNRVDLAALFEYKAAGQNVKEIKVFQQDLLVLASGRTIQSEPPRGVDQNIIKGLLNQTDPAIPKAEKELRETLNYAKTDSNYQTVTLEVTPEQSQIITYVMSTYADSLSLLLRNSDDRALERNGTTTLNDVMGPDSYMVRGEKAPPLRAAPRAKFFDYQGDQAVPVY